MENYFKLNDVIKITGFHRMTVIRHIKEGNLKCYKPKGSQEYRFTQKQIEDFVHSKPSEENDPYRNMKEGKVIWGRIKHRLTIQEKAKIAESQFKTTGIYLKEMKELDKKYKVKVENIG